MEKTRFEQAAEETLETLAHWLEAHDASGQLEVEYSDGVLTITLPSSRQYVLNRHRVTEQLWWSSPVSGAKYFTLREDGNWRDREDKELKGLLTGELGVEA